MTFRVPISAASVMGISWSNQGVVTIRGASSSSWPMAPGTMIAHAVDEPDGEGGAALQRAPGRPPPARTWAPPS